MKLVSRAQWGARAYRTPNGATPYSRARRGVKLHYLGSAYTDRTHEMCDDYVRQIQAQHMDGNGWSDIGYSFVVCTHGSVYEGRGLRRRNSANGSTSLNEQDYAVCLLVGSSGLTKPTDAQLSGARDAIDHCRTQGPAGTWLGGHRDGYATSCPGDAVYAWVKKGAPRPAGDGPKPGATAPAYEPFPGAAFFMAGSKPALGKRSVLFTAMGRRLVAVGCGRYTVGPGPTLGTADIASYEAWQRKCGHSGAAAKWPPGKSTWDLLKVPNV